MADDLVPVFSIESAGYYGLEEYLRVTRRTEEETLLRASAGFVRRVIRITPPYFDGEGDAAARTRGYRAISRDLSRVFTGVKIKGKRTEKYSQADVNSIHLRHLKHKRPGKPMRSDLGRGQSYYVRAAYLKNLENELRSHVGRLASGWMAAAQALGVTAVPQWVARHGSSRGTIVFTDEAGSKFVTVTNRGFPAEFRGEFVRRAVYAMKYQAAAMKREVAYLLRQDAQRLGLAG